MGGAVLAWFVFYGGGFLDRWSPIKSESAMFLSALLCMHVYIYVYMYTYITYIYIYTHVCLYTHTHTQIYAIVGALCVCIYIYIYIHTHIHMQECTKRLQHHFGGFAKFPGFWRGPRKSPLSCIFASRKVMMRS